MTNKIFNCIFQVASPNPSDALCIVDLAFYLRKLSRLENKINPRLMLKKIAKMECSKTDVWKMNMNKLS